MINVAGSILKILIMDQRGKAIIARREYSLRWAEKGCAGMDSTNVTRSPSARDVEDGRREICEGLERQAQPDRALPPGQLGQQEEGGTQNDDGDKGQINPSLDTGRVS